MNILLYRKEVYSMPLATFSVRMDKDIKKQFDALCADFGMSASTALNIYVKKVVRERRIPFDINSPDTEITRENGFDAFTALRKEAREKNIQDWTLDEINNEIELARNERENK
jgi:addiction module RelB/DinJ family antitoxin